MQLNVENEFKEHILELKNSNKLIIVEGKKDLAALKEFEVQKTIAINKPLCELINTINEKEVIILTDLDRTGKKLYSILKHNLQKKGIRINNKFRNFLIKETRLRNIEGLTSYINKI